MAPNELLPGEELLFVSKNIVLVWPEGTEGLAESIRITAKIEIQFIKVVG